MNDNIGKFGYDSIVDWLGNLDKMARIDFFVACEVHVHTMM